MSAVIPIKKENLSKCKKLYRIYTCPEGIAMEIYPIVYINSVYVYCKKPGAGYELECRHTSDILDPDDLDTEFAIKNLIRSYIPSSMFEWQMKDKSINRSDWSRSVFLWGPLKNLEALSEWAKQNYIEFFTWWNSHKLLEELDDARKHVSDLEKQCRDKNLL